eukprot:1377444-Alexandrium_andersonii.AAC.1
MDRRQRQPCDERWVAPGRYRLTNQRMAAEVALENTEEVHHATSCKEARGPHGAGSKCCAIQP